MEKDRTRASLSLDEIGSIVIPHDGCEGKYLGEAGCNRADEGDDEDDRPLGGRGLMSVPSAAARTAARVRSPI